MRLGRASLAIALLGALFGGLSTVYLARPHVAGFASPLDVVEAALTNLRLRLVGPVAPGDRVAIVAIDDAALADPRFSYPLGRDALAGIVSATFAAGAKAVAVDVLLAGPGAEAEADAALATALGEGPSVVASAATFDRAPAATRVPVAATVLWPADPFAEASRVGFVNLSGDASGTPRHVPLLILTERGPVPHLTVQAVSRYFDEPPRLEDERVSVGEARHPLDLGFHMPLRVKGPGGTIPTVSAGTLLDGASGQALSGKLVFIGFTASAVGDTFSTPYDPVTPGVELLAAAASQMMDGPRFRRTHRERRVDVVAAGALAVAGPLAVGLLPLTIGLPLALLALAAWLGATIVAFASGVWLAAGLPVAAALPAILATALARHLLERRRARQAGRAVEALSHFHSPALARRIADDPDFLRSPQTLPLAVLFVDLAGFTGHSEALGLEGTRSLLKAFHSAVAADVEAEGGMVLNYMGDGAMAAFGLTGGAADDADRALAASFALVRSVRALHLPDGGAVDLRIGLHAGTVLASRLGHDTHQQVTITGDGVNLASRLMEVAKLEGATIAASDDFLEALKHTPGEAADKRRVVPIRGRQAAVEVSLWTLSAAA
ncbi:MAG: adenylate/guanylate cyclase domain-containing protein [Pseudomonadota bacterium]